MVTFAVRFTLSLSMDAFTFSLDTLSAAARWLMERMDGHTVVAFHGAMGAGKTTFIKALCQELGVQDMVCSPTFAIINEYRDGSDRPIYHFDCYRLQSIDEARAIAVDDYLYSGDLCLIEWPEVVKPILPDDTLDISIEELPDGQRQLSIV